VLVYIAVIFMKEGSQTGEMPQGPDAYCLRAVLCCAVLCYATALLFSEMRRSIDRPIVLSSLSFQPPPQPAQKMFVCLLWLVLGWSPFFGGSGSGRPPAASLFCLPCFSVCHANVASVCPNDPVSPAPSLVRVALVRSQWQWQC